MLEKSNVTHKSAGRGGEGGGRVGEKNRKQYAILQISTVGNGMSPAFLVVLVFFVCLTSFHALIWLAFCLFIHFVVHRTCSVCCTAGAFDSLFELRTEGPKVQNSLNNTNNKR